MPRKLRIGLEGGLYHVITRGNDRRDVVHSTSVHLKFQPVESRCIYSG